METWWCFSFFARIIGESAFPSLLNRARSTIIMMAAAFAAAFPAPRGEPAASTGGPGALPTKNGSPPRFGVSKPSWIVRTESNVRKEKKKRPDPPCVVCRGSGRICCRHCRGRGRTNAVHLVMLPKGEWPKWCNVCGGSGFEYCYRCLGTGEYRDVMGFHFMKVESNPQSKFEGKQSNGYFIEW